MFPLLLERRDSRFTVQPHFPADEVSVSCPCVFFKGSTYSCFLISSAAMQGASLINRCNLCSGVQCLAQGHTTYGLGWRVEPPTSGLWGDFKATAAPKTMVTVNAFHNLHDSLFTRGRDLAQSTFVLTEAIVEQTTTDFFFSFSVIRRRHSRTRSARPFGMCFPDASNH